MTTVKVTAGAIDPDENRFYRVGGIASLAIGAAYIIIVMNAVLATIWLFLVGYRLYRLAQ